MTDLAPLPPTMTGTELIMYVNGLITRMNSAGAVDMPLIPLPSPWEDVRPAIDAIEDRLARWEQLSPEMADVLYAYQGGQDATDLAVSALVGDPSSTRSAVQSIADGAASAAVAPIAPDGGVQAVGKGELARNVLDYGVMGTGISDDTAALNACFAQGGDWLIPAGTYRTTGPLRITKSNTLVRAQAGVTFMVPAGYSGDAVLIGDTATQIINMKLLGPAEIKEPGKSGGAATIPGNWTAFHFHGNTTGVTDVTVEWVSWWANIRALYEITGAGWVNGTRVTANSWYPRVMLECRKNGSTAVGFAGNTWTDIVSQCGQHTTHVTKGLTGRGWTFKDVSPWDIGHNPAAVSLDVDADARSVTIVGGLMTTQNVQNRAPAGEVTVIDQSTLPPWSTRAVVGAADMALDSTQPAAATLVRRTQTLAWQFADAVISGVGFTLQVPPRATKATIVLHMAGTSGVSGNARMAVTLSSSAGAGTSLAAAFTARQATVPMGGNDVVVEAVLGELVTVPGQVLCMRPYRVGTDALDTYAGNVVLTAVTVVYRA